MARRIGPQLLAELEWETLLGLEKESREIRDLCKRRHAQRYAAFSDEQGFRIAGMVSNDPEPEAGVDHALAGIFCRRAAGQSLVFIHTLEDDETQAIVITVKAGRPELDRVIPTSDAVHEASLFVETMESTVQVLGNLSIPGVDTVATDIPLAHLLTAKEREISAVSSPARRGNGTALTVMALLLALASGGGMLAWLLWPESPPHRAPAMMAEQQDDYFERMREAQNRALHNPGHHAALAIQTHLTQIPIDIRGWRAASLQCTATHCEIVWQRGNGATIEDLLHARTNVKVHEENFDQARETVDLNTASEDGAHPLKLLPRLSFYEIASARANTLRDHGMEAQIGPASPLVPASESHDPAHRIVATGTWRLAGHLAFIDAVTGLMKRTGNMSLNALDIETDTTQPRFTASGDFYVD